MKVALTIEMCLIATAYIWAAGFLAGYIFKAVVR